MESFRSRQKRTKTKLLDQNFTVNKGRQVVSVETNNTLCTSGTFEVVCSAGTTAGCRGPSGGRLRPAKGASSAQVGVDHRPSVECHPAGEVLRVSGT
ncbi:hypothetical protein RUM43_001628 [Polyplax serrata]|uniref:Uncharacterized protein n=1 Tax=Polyplax serrata TaxID=468196 RepID=A0AAN8SI66_POLSC